MFQKKISIYGSSPRGANDHTGSFTASADEIGPGYDEQNKASTDTSVTDPANAWKR